MSTYFSYDHSAFLPPRDPANYDMAAALDLKPMSSYLADPFMLEDFQRSLMQPLMHPMAEPPHSFPYEGPAAGAPPCPSSSVAIYDVRRMHDIRHPTPVRPVPTSQLYSSARTMDAGGQGYEPQPAPFSSVPLSDPSTMVIESSVHNISPISAQPPPPPPPPPPPSWAMSGSLDPTTGIYQTAPEHPRVRTAQACDKCRSRKAKCSGELPCERCRLRGLECEYAIERKMRGPNKVKRGRGSDAKIKERRRRSVASSSSSTDEGSSSSPAAPFTSTPRHHKKSASGSDGMPPPPDPGSGAGPSLQAIPAEEQRGTSSPAQKARPTHIDLSGIHIGDHMGSGMAMPLGYHPEEDAHVAAHRRASLPSYLLEAYTSHHAAEQAVYSPPRGIEVVNAHVRPHSNPLYHDHSQPSLNDAIAVFDVVHSSQSDGSTSSDPRTPPSLAEGELLYPLGLHPEVGISQGDMDFSTFEQQYMDPALLGHHGWSQADMDVTPTPSADDRDKSFTQ